METKAPEFYDGFEILDNPPQPPPEPQQPQPHQEPQMHVPSKPVSIPMSNHNAQNRSVAFENLRGPKDLKNTFNTKGYYTGQSRSNIMNGGRRSKKQKNRSRKQSKKHYRKRTNKSRKH